MSKSFDDSSHGNKLELSMNDNGENDSKLVNSPQTTANEFTLNLALNSRTDCDDDDSIEPCIQSFSPSSQSSIKFNSISNNTPASHKTVDCARDLNSPDVNSTQCFQSPNQSSSKTPVQLKSEQSSSVLNNYVYKSNHHKDNNHSGTVYNDNNGNQTYGSAKHLVHWFRKGLRLHDQPALLKGLQGCDTFRCIYLIDPWFSTESNCGINKWRFLLQSLEDLDSSLHKLGSRLFVIRGQPAEVFPLLFKEWMITHLSFEEDPEPFGKIRDAKIAKMCKEMNIEVICETSHTLYRLEDIINHCSGEIPLTYLQFQNVISELGKPEEPVQTITHEIIGKAYTPVPGDHAKKYTVPTLTELGFTTQSNHRSVWVGGETEALQRLSRHLEHKAWVATFGKPKLTSLSLLCASQTGLGPYLRFGCISPRLLYHQLSNLYSKLKKGNPPLTLCGQLLWREFFYCVATNNPNFDKMQNNPLCVQIAWNSNAEALTKWANGQTGYPWIDAIQTQLRREGWIHQIAKHATVCFLTRGILWISWEEGMKVFDELLIDADWSVNAGTWMWLSCSSFFQRICHIYCPVSFGRKMDPQGDYIRRYLPVLRNIPNEYIHEPWKAPIKVQREANCKIGKHYPQPIVDHQEAMRINQERMKQVFRILIKGLDLKREDVQD